MSRYQRFWGCEKVLIGSLLFATFVFSIACRQAMPTGAERKNDPVLFQLSDQYKSLVDAQLMCTTTYGTGTDRLLLPGYYAQDGGLDIYRIRNQGDVFVFYGTGYGLFGEVYRVEQFDLKGNLIRKGEFRCGDWDVPVTLVRVTSKDDTRFPIYGVGTYNMRKKGSLFGGKEDIYESHANMTRGAYLNIDYMQSKDYLKKHGLHDHAMIQISFFDFEGEAPPLDESIVRQREDVYVESLEEGLNLPFLRFNRYDDYEQPPPYTPERP